MDMDTTTDVEPTGLNKEAVMKVPIRPGYMEQVQQYICCAKVTWAATWRVCHWLKLKSQI